MNVYLIQHHDIRTQVVGAFNNEKQAEAECTELNRRWVESQRKFLTLSGLTPSQASEWIINRTLPYKVVGLPVTLYSETPIPYETDEWRLSVYIDWKPKFVDIQCPACSGYGTVGGGFKDLDGTRECPQCFGRKYVSKGPSGKAPEVPPELLSAMRLAWADHLGTSNGANQ